MQLDVAKAKTPKAWLPSLADVDAVISAARALQDDEIHGVHVAGVTALYATCEAMGPRRVIHLSGIGVDSETPSEFSRTKRLGEAILMARDLDWVVLRPSIAIGRAAYGGSALLRGLAALPAFPAQSDAAPIQPVHLDDVVDTVVYFLRRDAPAHQALDLAGPRPMDFNEAVALFRS